jgi:ABC-type sugar transport system permease subunit
MGVGAATAVVMMVVLFIGSVIYLQVFKFAEEEEA